MFNNAQPTQTLVHLPRQQQQRSPEGELPRGECRYIIPADSEGTRHRCTCVSFSLEKSVPGSSCGCGHQAWHHVSEPAGNYVSVDEHHAVVEEFRKAKEQMRKLQEDIVKERREREKTVKDIQQGYYQNLYYMRYYIDEKMEKLRFHLEDKMDNVEDKATELQEMKKQILDLDENVMRLEEKYDSPRRQSRSLTPLLEGQASPSQFAQSDKPAELPFRTERRYPESWDCRVILVPSKFLSFAFTFDSIPYRRCQTRGLHQDLQLRDRSSHTFTQSVEANFMAILRRRPWMPLQCLRSSDMSLGKLRTEAIRPELWDYAFIESQCMANDKMQGDVIYIALQHEDLSWDDIRSFPHVFGSDESCWEHNDDWDKKSKEAIAAEDRMETDRPRPDTESTYSSPPPYTSRASMYSPDTPRQGPIRNNPLDVLAAASLAGRPTPSISERSHYSAPGAPSISERTNYSAPSIISEHSVSSMGSIDSTLALSEADEHRNKRTKRGIFLRSPSQPMVPAPGGSIQSAPNSPPQGQMYYSGRSKRKIPANKHKDPMDWRPSEISFKNLLHRHDSKEKRPQTSSGSHHSAQSHDEHAAS